MIGLLTVLALSSPLALAVAPIWSPNCGQSQYADAGDMFLPAGHIVGGMQARPYEFPWQASIRRKSTDSHFCGGSILTSRWILTAAHCMRGQLPNGVSVVVGEHQQSAASSVRQHLDVQMIQIHASYSALTMRNDIALIKVATDVTFNVNVQPVCAPDAAYLYTHLKCQCSGWGTLVSGGTCCPDILQYVSMNITSNSFCDEAYTQPIFAENICASDNNGGTERDSCQGDSGGPLTIKESDGTFRVVGIVSWGIGCASGYPGVYTRVSSYNDWIQDIMNANP